MRLRHGSATDVGRIRSTNQDRVLVVSDRFYAVADGMGGHRGGDTAAQIAVDVIGTIVIPDLHHQPHPLRDTDPNEDPTVRTPRNITPERAFCARGATLQ